MSDNKKYYYMKLKDNFFDQDQIKVIESYQNGYIYVCILLKLYLRSIKHEGKLCISEGIPYRPDMIESIAHVIGHDPSHVRDAINLASSVGLITITDAHEIWMTDVQMYIGRSSSEADRIREYRENLKKTGKNTHKIEVYKCTPEKEIEIEIEKDIDASDKSAAIPLIAKIPDINNDTTKKPKTETIDELISAAGLSVAAADAFGEFLHYKKERKEKYTIMGIKKLLNQVKRHSDADIQAAVDKSIMNNWRGLFFNDDGKKQQTSPLRQFFDARSGGKWEADANGAFRALGGEVYDFGSKKKTGRVEMQFDSWLKACEDIFNKGE